MTTRFQINVDSCAFRELTSFFKCQHLGVFDSFIAVKALPNDNVIFHDNGSYQRVGRYLTFTFRGKCERAIEKVKIVVFVGSCIRMEGGSDHGYSNCTSLKSIDTISISVIGRRSGARVYARLLVGR